jgi:hypothetical protein
LAKPPYKCSVAAPTKGICSSACGSLFDESNGRRTVGSRHGLDANEACFLCDQESESIDHIVVSCSFSKQVWWSVLSAVGQPQGMPNFNTIFDRWNGWRLMWSGNNKLGADTLFALVVWELWKERNTRCFGGATTQIPQLLACDHA